jgi:hypothetical protein
MVSGLSKKKVSTQTQKKPRKMSKNIKNPIRKTKLKKPNRLRPHKNLRKKMSKR